MPTRAELDALARRVPNQKGARVDQVDAMAAWSVDVTEVGPDRHPPVERTTAMTGFDDAAGVPSRKEGGRNG